MQNRPGICPAFKTTSLPAFDPGEGPFSFVKSFKTFRKFPPATYKMECVSLSPLSLCVKLHWRSPEPSDEELLLGRENERERDPQTQSEREKKENDRNGNSCLCW